MRILVTGGAGFIGSHVVDVYRAAGHEVAVLDNLSTGKRRNLEPGVAIYEGSLQDPGFVSGVMQEFLPEAVNHHAAQISVTASVRDPYADAQTNILGVTALLGAMVEHVPQAKLIYASSGGAMYGAAAELPYQETAIAAPQSPYGLSKYVAEQYVWLFARLHGLAATVLRYANVYGPRQDPHGEAGVCAIFSERMMAGDKPVTLFGDGSATRDYVFVQDVARASLAALSGGTGESFNIGTGKEVSTKEVFVAFADAFQYALEPLSAPLRPGEIPRSVLDVRKAKRLLGWEAEVPFAEGARKTAEWYRNDALAIHNLS